MWKKLATTTAVTLTLAGGTFAADKAIDPYDDKGTHYELNIKADIDQGERIEIAKDRPAMTFKGWHDEYAITIIPQIPITSAKRPLLSKKMEYTAGDIIAFIEPKAGTDTQVDIDFTLTKKTATNTFSYRIEGADDFDFKYQPGANIEYNDPACTPTDCQDLHYPDEVVGSYAVYHKTKSHHVLGTTNYATGKVLHIYRPKAIDANGVQVWGQLSYQNGLLTVTIPAAFLDTAAYPVVIDPTFGRNSVGAASVALTQDLLLCYRASAPATGTVTDISSYGDSSGTVNWKGGMYDDASSPNLDTTGQGDATDYPTSSGWATSTFSGGKPSITSGSFYNICILTDTGGNIFRDTGGSGNTINTVPPVYPTFPNPAGTQESTSIYSIYATYTVPSTATPDTTYFEIIN